MGATQVLDLASGVAPRGLILSEDPSVMVIETDLPEMIAEKQAIVASLVHPCASVFLVASHSFPKSTCAACDFSRSSVTSSPTCGSGGV